MVPLGVRKQSGLSPVQSAQLATTIQGEFKQSTQAKPGSSPRFSQEHGLGQSVDPVQTLTQVPLLQLPLQHSLSAVQEPPSDTHAGGGGGGGGGGEGGEGGGGGGGDAQVPLLHLPLQH
jgi:hypothetical protein